MAKCCPICAKENLDETVKCSECGSEFPVPRPMTLDEVINLPGYVNMKELTAVLIAVFFFMLYLL